MLVPTRNYSNPVYRYSFQGQEKDNEIKGIGNSINYKFRMHSLSRKIFFILLQGLRSKRIEKYVFGNPRVGRFFAVDPLAGKYAGQSPYVFVGGNPIGNREVDGRYFVGTDGKKVKFRRRKDGTIKVGRNASADLRELVNSVNHSGSSTAVSQIMLASKNKTKIHVKIETEVIDNGLLGQHQAHDKDGNVLEWDSEKGDFNGTPAYVEDGVYKEATITIFKGNIEESGGNAKYYGFDITNEQEIANTFQHECNHDTDKEFIQDLKNKREEKPNKGIDPHKNIYPQEQKVYKEMDKHNKK